MSYNSAISWTDSTWNPIVGCSKVSAGCLNCYAEKMAHRQAHMEITRGGPDRYGEVLDVCGKWNGETVFVESALTKPLHWRKPRKIFVCSMSDLFHESVPFEWVLKIIGIIIATPWHSYYFLTKRPQRMYKFFAAFPDGWLIREGMKHTSFSYEFFALHAINGVITNAQVQRANDYWKSHYDQSERGKLDGPVPHPIPNLHLGVSVENQDNVWRIAELVKTPAAKRSVSFEPLLHGFDVALKGIDYIFLGCESGPRARLCKLHAIRHMIRQAHNAGALVHVKQIPLDGKCNKHIEQWPKEFQVREV